MKNGKMNKTELWRFNRVNQELAKQNAELVLVNSEDGNYFMFQRANRRKQESKWLESLESTAIMVSNILDQRIPAWINDFETMKAKALNEAMPEAKAYKPSPIGQSIIDFLMAIQKPASKAEIALHLGKTANGTALSLSALAMHNLIAIEDDNMVQLVGEFAQPIPAQPEIEPEPESAMPKLTKGELALVKELAIRLQPGEPNYSDVIAEDLEEALQKSRKSIGGTLSSLIKKGVVYVDDNESSLDVNFHIIYLNEIAHHFIPGFEA